MTVAGAQQSANGIHRGLVNMIKVSTQKTNPTITYSKLDYKKISRKIIIENSENFNSNLADLLHLFII